MTSSDFPEGEEKGGGTENVSENIMAVNFSNLI